MKEKLKKIINTIISERSEGESKVQIKELTHDLSLREDIGMSSLELASLTVMIEDEYDVDIFEDGLVGTIGEIMDILDRRV